MRLETSGSRPCDYYGLEDGTVELHPNNPPLPEGFDPKVRPWYQAGIVSEDDPVWVSFEEIITGQQVISTAVPLMYKGSRIGVFATDITVGGLNRILESMQLPEGSSVFLLNEQGVPLVGTDQQVMEQGRFPETGDSLFVESSSSLMNGWRLVVVIPRGSFAKAFSELRRPIMFTSAILFLLSAFIMSALAIRLGSRAHALADYFEDVIEEGSAQRELFDTDDEFSHLNRQFNKVINAARASEEQKLSRERTYRRLLEQVPMGFFRSSTDGKLLMINTYGASLLGYTQEEALALPSLMQLYYDKGECDSYLNEVRIRGSVCNKKLRAVKKSGELIWVTVTSVLGQDSKDADEKVIDGFIIDITDEVEEREALVNMTETDPMTGVGNRRALKNALDEAAQYARKNGHPVSLILFDLDNLKEINDMLGHEAGDKAIQHAVAVAQSVLRSNDTLVRTGGDEFVILLPGAYRDTAEAIAERLLVCLEVSEPPKEIAGVSTLTASIGVASQSGTEVDACQLLNDADAAMYRIKQVRRSGAGR